MPYDVVAHAGAAAFLARAEPWLLSREAENNLILSLAYARRDKGLAEPDALFATVEAEGMVVGCALRTPPHKLLLTRMPVGAAADLIAVVSELYEEIPAVLGPGPEAEAVATAWVERRGGRCRPGLPQRIYRVDTVVPPKDVPGRLRPARESDVDLATEFAAGFARDAGQQFAIGRDGILRHVERKALYLWEDREPVCMVVAQGVTPNGCRIGFVYTPESARGNGYASAATAAASQAHLDAGGSFCVLYTDLTNPVSNRIYQRIGYRPVLDVRDVDIHLPDTPVPGAIG